MTDVHPQSFMALMHRQMSLIRELVPLGEALTLRELHRFVEARSDPPGQGSIRTTAEAVTFLVQEEAMILAERDGEFSAQLLRR